MKLIHLNSIVDSRGALTVANALSEVPFEVKRVFWITAVPEGQSRGSHAHVSNRQFIVCVHGSFRLRVYDGKEERTFNLSDPQTAVLVGAGEWCQLEDFSQGCTVLVLSSEPYNRDGYLNTREDYERWLSTSRMLD